MWHGKRSRWDRIEERLHRALEICLGLILAVAAVGLSTVTLFGAYDVLRGKEQDRVGLTVLVVAILGSLAYVAGITAWRLLSRRERPGGGLFPPWLLYLAGAGMSSVAAAKRTVWGGPPFGAAEEQIANEYFELGRTRRLKKRNRKRERRR